MPHVHFAIRFLVLAIAFVLRASSVQAALVTYTDQANFLAAVDDPTKESFEGVDDRSASSAPIVTGPFTIVIESEQASVRSSPAGGHFPTDGVKYVQPTDLAVLRFDLNIPATSFGLSITDWGDQNAGTLTISTDLGDASTGIQIAESPGDNLEDGNELFFGLVQDIPFSAVTITSTSPGDGWGIDEVYFTSIPEPATLNMAVFGLLAIIACGWRRKRRRLIR